MTHVQKNVFANTVSSLWIPLLGLAFAPLYIKYMGLEGFALVGLFVTIQALSVPLDAGLRTTLSRELARLGVLENTAQKMRDMTKTLEIIYLSVAVLLGVLIITGSGIISRYWLNPKVLSHQEVLWSLILMGVVLMFQWPMHLYSGGLIGLEHQVVLSVITVVMYTLRYAGVVPLLIWGNPSPVLFFGFQSILALIQTSLLRVFLLKYLPPTNRKGRFCTDSLKSIWRFTTGMSGITIIGALLTQMDRILLSNGRLLSLKMFGYYSLAALAASVLPRIVLPVRMAISPRLTALVSLCEENELARLYHRGCQVNSVLLLTPAIFGIVFAPEVLMVWTNDVFETRNTYLVLRLLLLAWTFNGLMCIPFGLQLAYGWTRLAFTVNLVGCLVLCALMTVLAIFYQAVGAVVALGVVFAGQAAVSIYFMHRKILRGHARRWLVHDVGLPLVVICGVAGVAKWLLPTGLSRWGAMGCLLAIGSAGFCIAGLACPEIRGSVKDVLARVSRRADPLP